MECLLQKLGSNLVLSSKYSTNPGIMNFNNFENLINRFNEVIEVISNGTDDASIKQQLRNLQLKKIIDDDTSF